MTSSQRRKAVLRTVKVLKYWQDSFEPLGLDFMDQIKKEVLNKKGTKYEI